VGQMVNLIAVDCNTLFMLTTFLNIIWSGPFQIIVSIFMLWRYIGVASLAGLAIMLVFIPFNIGLGTISKNLRKKKLVLTDSRIKATNDMLNGIKVF
jgi:glycopeptide antibiotics resistance protein